MVIKKLNDRYSFIQQISSRKGIGVYLAYDEITAGRVIIKEMTGARMKKENDFSILRKLRHPGIPLVTDAFECGSAMYIVMENIEGGNLSEIIEKEGVFSEERALRATCDILKVLDYLHSMKPDPMVHGDIKPENILVDEERLIIIDFGSVSENEASSGFCAPERLAGISKSVESDIYSVGEVLHFMLTGDVKKIYNRKKSEAISNDIYRVIEKSTKKIAGERYQRAADMKAAVERILKLRESGVGIDSVTRTLCIPGCPEAACEAAYAAGLTGRNVLIADLDMLSPSVHTILGVDKFKYSLQDFLAGSPAELKTRCIGIRNNKVKMLPCVVDYENYEDIRSDCIPALIAGASGFFDIVIFSCGSFPYDRFFLDSLIYSDAVIFPVQKGVVDIKRYNSLVKFMSDRQNVSPDKMFFMGVNTNGSNISPMLAAGVVETSWLGSIPYSAERISLYSSGKAYVFSLKKKVYSRCIRMMKKTGVLS